MELSLEKKCGELNNLKDHSAEFDVKLNLLVFEKEGLITKVFKTERFVDCDYLTDELFKM